MVATDETSNILKIMKPDWKHRGQNAKGTKNLRRKEFIRTDGKGLFIEVTLCENNEDLVEFILFEGKPWESKRIEAVRIRVPVLRDQSHYKNGRTMIGFRVCRAYGDACAIFGVDE